MPTFSIEKGALKGTQLRFDAPAVEATADAKGEPQAKGKPAVKGHLAVNATFFLIGCTIFPRRDLKS